MKKIINGKMYNTATAKPLAHYTNNKSCYDLCYIEEVLFIKKTGEYFLFGCGGAMTKYSEPDGYNGIIGGEKLIPFTEDEAKKWAETHIDCDEYEKIFGEVEE